MNTETQRHRVYWYIENSVSPCLCVFNSYNIISMITLYLARHGQTEENLSRIFQGHLPGHLTEEGKRQAVALGESLKDIALDAINTEGTYDLCMVDGSWMAEFTENGVLTVNIPKVVKRQQEAHKLIEVK